MEITEAHPITVLDWAAIPTDIQDLIYEFAAMIDIPAFLRIRLVCKRARKVAFMPQLPHFVPLVWTERNSWKDIPSITIFDESPDCESPLLCLIKRDLFILNLSGNEDDREYFPEWSECVAKISQPEILGDVPSLDDEAVSPHLPIMEMHYSVKTPCRNSTMTTLLITFSRGYFVSILTRLDEAEIDELLKLASMCEFHSAESGDDQHHAIYRAILWSLARDLADIPRLSVELLSWSDSSYEDTDENENENENENDSE